MRGTVIKFEAAGPRLDFTDVRRDFACTVQNALTHVGTDYGTDRVYPERGTDLLRLATSGTLVNRLWADQRAGLAALRVLAFTRQTDSPANQDQLQEFKLRAVQMRDGFAEFLAQAVSSRGERAGMMADLKA